MARNKVKDPNHLSFGRLMAWKSSDISAGWVNVIMLNYLSMYASDFLGLNIGLVGVMLFVSKLMDGLVDFFIGWLVDNTKTPWGRALEAASRGAEISMRASCLARRAMT